jgi:hypothetical protein
MTRVGQSLRKPGPIPPNYDVHTHMDAESKHHAWRCGGGGRTRSALFSGCRGPHAAVGCLGLGWRTVTVTAGRPTAPHTSGARDDRVVIRVLSARHTTDHDPPARDVHAVGVARAPLHPHTTRARRSVTGQVGRDEINAMRSVHVCRPARATTSVRALCSVAGAQQQSVQYTPVSRQTCVRRADDSPWALEKVGTPRHHPHASRP